MCLIRTNPQVLLPICELGRFLGVRIFCKIFQSFFFIFFDSDPKGSRSRAGWKLNSESENSRRERNKGEIERMWRLISARTHTDTSLIVRTSTRQEDGNGFGRDETKCQQESNVINLDGLSNKPTQRLSVKNSKIIKSKTFLSVILQKLVLMGNLMSTLFSYNVFNFLGYYRYR